MKFGESAFDILYLFTVIICGIVILIKSESNTERKMGWAAIILGTGDAFHLVPRIINYFSANDLSAALGIGKFVTSVSMTLFYVLLYYIWLGVYRKKEDIRLSVTVWTLFAVRTGLCLFPQNGWLQDSSNLFWGIIRNIPFVILGILIVLLYYRCRNMEKKLKLIWIYVILSFLFYIPVVVGTGAVPMLGMLMLPKTICYVLIVISFLMFVLKKDDRKTKV